MQRVGIAIITYNRRDAALRTYAAVRDMTKSPHVLIVADDGSQDDTVAALRTEGALCVTGKNRNVAWNKNRALYALHAVAGCETIILLEDDCFPTLFGWEQGWIAATERYGHINLLSAGVESYVQRDVAEYQGLALTTMISAQCASFSKAALDAVGYFDSRFTGHGYEHVEHSKRMLKAGWGGYEVTPQHHLFYSLRSAVALAQGETFSTPDAMACNEEVYYSLSTEPMRREPWRSEQERQAFLEEVGQVACRFTDNNNSGT